MEAAGKYYTGRRNGIKNVSGVNVLLLHVSNFNFPPRSGCKITNQVRRASSDGAPSLSRFRERGAAAAAVGASSDDERLLARWNFPLLQQSLVSFWLACVATGRWRLRISGDPPWAETFLLQMVLK